MTYFSTDFLNWLDANAEQIDQTSGGPADELLKRIADEGIYRIGIPEEYGGTGGDKTQLIDAISELGQHSLTAAFISWGHANFIDNIFHADNPYIRETYLNDLLSGEVAGATGLSNAVKFLSKLEELNVTISEENGKRYLSGQLPWVTNVRSDHFVAIFCAGFDVDTKKPIIVTIPSTAEHFTRTEDLEFVALQGANTAALVFDKTPLKDEWILSNDAVSFIAQNRPSFLGFQFGLAFGLAERSLDEVEKSLPYRKVLKDEWQVSSDKLNTIKEKLYQGLLSDGDFVKFPKKLFQLRIDIVDVVAQSLLLELQAGGGRGYLSNSESGFIRRWNEGAFLPIVSPSAVQLRHILATN